MGWGVANRGVWVRGSGWREALTNGGTIMEHRENEENEWNILKSIDKEEESWNLMRMMQHV